jgi:hypothetical protein
MATGALKNITSSSFAGSAVHVDPWSLLRLLFIGPDPVDFRLKFLMTIVFKSSSTESSRLIAGPPARRVTSNLCTINFLQGVCSVSTSKQPKYKNSRLCSADMRTSQDIPLKPELFVSLDTTQHNYIRGVQVNLQTALTSSLSEDKWSASGSSHFIPT